MFIAKRILLFASLTLFCLSACSNEGAQDTVADNDFSAAADTTAAASCSSSLPTRFANAPDTASAKVPALPPA